MNAGARTVEWLFREQLSVDPERSVQTPNGFVWWADKNAQTVEVVGQEPGPDGEEGDLISVRTEVLRSLQLDNRALAAVDALLMPFASMAGPVYEEQTRTLLLASMVRVHDDICPWMNPLIGMAAVLQIGEARIIGPELARILDAEEALSGPPGRGLQPEPDELAEIIATLIAPMGQQPSRWVPAEFQEAVDMYMNQPPALLATCGGAEFTVEFSHGDQSSLCRATADQPHPRYGNGLFLLQSFPVAVQSDLEGVSLALAMNGSELTQGPFGYGFGSYCYRDGMLHFTAFFPNTAYRRGLLPNLYFSCARRAREMSVRLTGVDWTAASYSPRRSALGRLADRSKGR